MSEFSITADQSQWMKEIGRHIHTFPETSFNEVKTAAYICKKLTELDISFQDSVAETGIVAIIGESVEKLPCIALRADMDALPIEEKTGLSFASQNPGVMHACGHDGHIAMLLGAASLLTKCQLPGSVKLIFQPAEETGGGAQQMVQQGSLNGVDAIISGHIDRHLNVGEIAIQPGLINAYTDEFTIEITGRGGHAAKPHETTDTILIASSLVSSLQSLVSREIDPQCPAVISIGKIAGGSAPNIIAEKAVLEGTIRCTDDTIREQLMGGISRMVKAMETLYKAQAQVTFVEGYPPVVNDPAVTGIARSAAQKIIGENGVMGLSHPSMGGEDFSFYLKNVPGCFVRFGAMKNGLTAAAHSSQFDFDERVLGIGACFLAQSAYDYLSVYS